MLRNASLIEVKNHYYKNMPKDKWWFISVGPRRMTNQTIRSAEFGNFSYYLENYRNQSNRS